MNRENLKILADYLLSGKLLVEFHMGMFSEYALGDTQKAMPTCGSIGCAVGHSPYAGLPEKAFRESWIDYSYRVFDMSAFEAEWAWCFDSPWADVDNTPEGAGKRILYLLDEGLPDNWYEQRQGFAPLSYK